MEGVTLVELIVTLAIAAILFLVAVPSFQAAIAANRRAAATNDLVSALSHARMEAIRRNQRVTVCKGVPGATQCDTVTTTSWASGWIVFVDPTTQSPPQIEAAGDILLRGGGQPPGDISVRGNGNVNLYVSYTGDGMSKLMGGGFQAGTIRVCSISSALNDNDRARDVVINSGGRIITTKPTAVNNTCPTP